MSLTTINETKSKLPKSNFLAIKNTVLGTKYSLNLIFTNSAKIKQLNTIYRDKECATDILSFPLSNNEGEIYISPKEAKLEAKKFDKSYKNFIGFLFIHGCVHLKGHDHGAIMDSIEEKIRQKFGI